jgi:hypothetical protein
MANSSPREPATGTWPVVRTAIVNGSPAVKRLVRRVAAFWMLMIALQVWDSRNGQGAAGLTEFFSAFLGLCGIALLGIAGTLHLSMKEAADGTRTDDTAIARVLLALPTIGLLAGVALGGAAILMMVRAVLGAELLFAIAGTAVYGGLMIVAARTVTRSAQTLFDVGIAHARRAADYRNAATAARLDALQARMHPHVIFNALNTIVALIHSSPPAAERAVHTLADVLRQTLERSSDSDATVAKEVAFVQSILALERERWREHLTVVWSIDAEVGEWHMPPLVIQPLVENALRHGLGSRIEGGRIAISIGRDGDTLVAAVDDDGLGFRRHWREGNGIGNLRQRLDALYGSAASVTIERPDAGGARVTVRLPKQSAPALGPAAADTSCES